MLDLFVGAIKIVVMAYLGYVGLLFFLQRNFLFPGGTRVPELGADSDLRPGMQRVRLDMYAGVVEAWYMEAPTADTPGPALIFAHGNAELMEDWTQLEDLAKLGIGVLLVEFPGYGYSEGRTTRLEIGDAFNEGYVLERNSRLSDGQGNWVVETLSPRIWRLGVRFGLH